MDTLRMYGAAALEHVRYLWASMVDDPMRFVGIATCVIVLAAVACRIDQMRPRFTRLAWLVIYLLFAIFALGVLLDLARDRWVDWYDSAGVCGVLLYMIATRTYWRTGQDPITVRGDLRHADGSALEEGA